MSYFKKRTDILRFWSKLLFTNFNLVLKRWLVLYLITTSLITFQTFDIIFNTPPTVRHCQQLSSIVETAVAACRRRLTQPPKSLDTSMAINISVSPLLCMRRRPQSTCATSLAATRRWGIAHFPHARHVTSSVVQTLVDYLGQRSHPVYSLRVCPCCWSFVLLKQKSFGKQITLMSKHQGNEREKIRLNCFGTEALYFQCNYIFYNAELAGGMTRRVLIWLS